MQIDMKDWAQVMALVSQMYTLLRVHHVTLLSHVDGDPRPETVVDQTHDVLHKLETIGGLCKTPS